MRIAVAAVVGVGLSILLPGCAGEAPNPNGFGAGEASGGAGVAGSAEVPFAGAPSDEAGGTTGAVPASNGGSDAYENGGATSGAGAGSNGGVAASGGSAATFGTDGGVSSGGANGAGGSGAGGASCGGFLQPPCATGGAGGAACGGFLEPPCGTGGAGGDSDAGGADQCANETCFDIFDCYLYFPNASACKFTKCDGLICKP